MLLRPINGHEVEGVVDHPLNIGYQADDHPLITGYTLAFFRFFELYQLVVRDVKMAGWS